MLEPPHRMLEGYLLAIYASYLPFIGRTCPEDFKIDRKITWIGLILSKIVNVMTLKTEIDCKNVPLFTVHQDPLGHWEWMPPLHLIWWERRGSESDTRWTIWAQWSSLFDLKEENHILAGGDIRYKIYHIYIIMVHI